MPRQRSSFGSVTRMGRDHYRLRWWADTPEGRKRLTEMFDGTRREAERRMAEIRVGTKERRCPTLGEIWEEHELPHLVKMRGEDRISERTLQAYTRRWEADVAPRWADVPADMARPADIQEWLLTMTRSMGELSKAVLSLTYERAVMLGILDANPCARRYDLGPATRRPKVAYTPEQLDEAWEAVRGTVAEAPFLLMAHAGLRVGEACGMRSADVEPREGCAVLHVSAQLRQDGEVSERMKTAGSRRTAVIEEPWASRVLELAGGTYVNERQDSTPVPSRTVTDRWKRCVEAAGLPVAPMQCLRPSYQTNLHWQGVPIEQTSRLLGHTATKMTLENYDRPSDDQLVNVVLSRGVVTGT